MTCETMELPSRDLCWESPFILFFYELKLCELYIVPLIIIACHVHKLNDKLHDW